MFSILRSACVYLSVSRIHEEKRRQRTSMHHIVLMTILQRAPNLPRELPCYPLAQLPMADDIIKHLPAADVLRDHIIMVLVHDHLAHAADVRVVEEHG